MWWKKTLTLIALMVTAAIIFASGSSEAAGDPLSGTWFGGSEFSGHAGWKYQYSISPVDDGVWTVLGQGAYYDPSAWGGPVVTKWTGEIIRIEGEYRSRIMIMVLDDTTIPPMKLPVIIAYEAWLSDITDDSLTLSYISGAQYAYGDMPFVDDPTAVFLSNSDPPVVEYLRRLPTRE
jgi:hypothetical protein